MFFSPDSMSVPEFLLKTKETIPNGYSVLNVPDGYSAFNMQNTHTGINKILEEMTNLLMHTPEISLIKGIAPIFNLVRVISWGCISLIVVYIGYNNLIAAQEIDMAQKIDEKKILGKMAYAICMSSFALNFLDILINLNNTLIQVLTSYFAVGTFASNALGGTFGAIITIAMLLGEAYFAIKVVIGYWMRISELVFMGVISPAIYTIGIFPSWKGFTSHWNRRVVTLIFTQLCQVILMVIYTALVSGLALSGTFSGLCLSIGMLMLMCQTPRILSQFMESSDNSINIVKRGFSTVKKSFKNPITSKLKSLGGR